MLPLFLTALCGLQPARSSAPRPAQQEVAAGPVYRGRERQLTVELPRCEASVAVDGRLDEPVWREAAVLDGFSQFSPSDGTAAVDSTQVLVWYSPTAIHFGIRAFQPAGSVRATLADRDRISQDDYIQILLSTFNDGRQADVFMVNPLGVQADGTLVERGTSTNGGFTATAVTTREPPDLSSDFVFQSKGHVTDWGYEVEIRIPFKSLRYQATDVQAWGVNIVRKVQYNGFENSWTPAQRGAASFLGQSGTLGGLTRLHRGLVVDITPEVTQRTEGTPATAGGWQYDAKNPKVGGNIRWGVTNNLTFNGTVNPDFSQVEADAGQVSFDPRAALSYPEKRPFFLDGLEQFTVPNNLIYTRQVVQPVAAVKLTGKTGRNEIAVLSAVDAASASTSGHDNPMFNIVRLQRDLGSQSRIGMSYTDRVDGSNWNRVMDVDGRVVLRRVYALQMQLAGSATERAGVRLNAPLWDVRFLRSGHGLSWRSQFTGISDDFRTESGFISRTGQVHANFTPSYTIYGKRGALFEQYGGEVLLDDIWAYRNFMRSGDARDKKLHFTLNTQLRGGWLLRGSLILESFGFDPEFYKPLYRIEVPRAGLPSDTLAFTGTARLPNRDWLLSFTTPQMKYLTLSAYRAWGQDENFSEWSSAAITAYNASADIRPSDQLRIGMTYVLLDYRRKTDGTRVSRTIDPRVKVEYQVTRSIFVRVIGEYITNFTDSLRDDSRTNFPLLVYDQGAQQWVRTKPGTDNDVRTDFLFSYRPTPGTVFYAGYGARMTEPEAFAFRGINRRTDAFFLKASYLFRM